MIKVENFRIAIILLLYVVEEQIEDLAEKIGRLLPRLDILRQNV